uniref:VWFA domain-containing protein n=1 Tax=Poecilia mexicana TaxID=48701 RepID=A0A3B3YEH4_9TELE
MDFIREEYFTAEAGINTADVVFIIDESGGIGNNNFQLIQSFVQSLIGSLNVNQTGVRVGIVTYNEAPKAHAYLDSFQDRTEAQQFIKLLPYRGGGSNTGAALRFTLESVFKGRGSREDVQKVAIVVTDSKSQDSVKEAVAELHWFPVRVFAIGVNEKTPDLYDMEGGNRLTLFTAKVTEKSVDAFCEDAPSDVIFLTESSERISAEDFRKMKEFMKSVVTKSIVGLNDMRVGVMQFSTRTKVEFRLNQYFSKDEILEAIDNMKQQNGGVETGRALTEVSQFFSEGGRRSFRVPQILMVITDGAATNPDNLRKNSDALRANNITVFSIGVENANKTELLIMAGNNQSNVFYVDKFDQLETLYKQISGVICSITKHRKYGE